MSEEASRETLGAEEREALVRFARQSLQAALAGGPKPPRPREPALERPRGAFVTLRRRADGALRGCIGLVRADRPLNDVVADVAIGAALRDGRFDPVTAGELPALGIEISALGPTFRIRPDALILGEMGLLVRARGRQGLLLPQVPLEHGWDRDTFLEQACAKAGLPSSAWREAATEIFAFRCEVFGE
jgi:AmmeMemoRadiSam system protein A